MTLVKSYELFGRMMSPMIGYPPPSPIVMLPIGSVGVSGGMMFDGGGGVLVAGVEGGAVDDDAAGWIMPAVGYV